MVFYINVIQNRGFPLCANKSGTSTKIYNLDKVKLRKNILKTIKKMFITIIIIIDSRVIKIMKDFFLGTSYDKLW